CRVRSRRSGGGLTGRIVGPSESRMVTTAPGDGPGRCRFFGPGCMTLRLHPAGWHHTRGCGALLPRSRRGADTMGMVAPVYYTADMVRALPDDGNRYEVVYGELLVSPAPRLWHQEVVARMCAALDGYLRDEPVGEAFTAPADISGSRQVLVQPDVFV